MLRSLFRTISLQEALCSLRRSFSHMTRRLIPFVLLALGKHLASLNRQSLRNLQGRLRIRSRTWMGGLSVPMQLSHRYGSRTWWEACNSRIKSCVVLLEWRLWTLKISNTVPHTIKNWNDSSDLTIAKGRNYHNDRSGGGHWDISWELIWSLTQGAIEMIRCIISIGSARISRPDWKGRLARIASADAEKWRLLRRFLPYTSPDCRWFAGHFGLCS